MLASTGTDVEFSNLTGREIGETILGAAIVLLIPTISLAWFTAKLSNPAGKKKQ